jgi:hypothetical protein
MVANTDEEASWYESTTMSTSLSVRNLVEKSKDNRALRNWIVTTMRARMVEMNMLKSQFPRIEFDAESTNSTVSEIDVEINDPVSGNYSSQYDIEFPEIEEGARVVAVGIEDRFGFFDSDIDALLEDPKSFTVSREMFLRKQPFWDMFLNEARKMIKNGSIKTAGLLTRKLLMECGLNTNVETTVSDFMNF